MKELSTRADASIKSVVTIVVLAMALIALGLSWPKLAAGRAGFVESVYAGRIYPAVAQLIASATSRVPFSIAEYLIYAGIALCAYALIGGVIRLVLRRATWRVFVRMIVSLLLVAGVVLNLFYLTWGFHYFREPVDTRMELDVCKRTSDELYAFVEETANAANALRLTCSEDADGVFSPNTSPEALFKTLPDAYDALKTKHDALVPFRPTPAKYVGWARFLSRRGISGVYIGLTAEPNVNTDQPPLLWAQAAAHEMAHYLGFASENEAEFVACLACLASDDNEVRYSGLIYALIVAGNALHRADAERYNALAATYSDALWRDLYDYNAYWDAFEGKARERADSRNDAYLKHNSQESGVKSYGEAVDLLLAYRAKFGFPA